MICDALCILSYNNVNINNDAFVYTVISLYIFMHLTDAFIQSDLQCIQAIFLSVHVFPVCMFVHTYKG